jgi:hypothetical protein
MPRFVHKTIRVPVGQEVQISDDAIFTGSNIIADGAGGFDIELHLLERLGDEGARPRPVAIARKDN